MDCTENTMSSTVVRVFTAPEMCFPRHCLATLARTHQGDILSILLVYSKQGKQAKNGKNDCLSI
jgi:hypothetical protein